MADNGMELRIESYCAFCPNFEPDVEKVDITVAMDKTQRMLTTIRCDKRQVCEQLHERLRVENG